jgi:hypothetical protein
MKPISLFLFCWLLLACNCYAQDKQSPDELTHMGLAAQLMYIKHVSEMVVTKRLVALHPELKDPKPTQSSGGGGSNPGNKGGQVHYYLKAGDYDDPVIQTYFSLRFESEQILAEMISDLDRNKFHYYRKLDKLLITNKNAASLKDNGTNKMDHYADNLAVVYQTFKKLLAVKDTAPPAYAVVLKKEVIQQVINNKDYVQSFLKNPDLFRSLIYSLYGHADLDSVFVKTLDSDSTTKKLYTTQLLQNADLLTAVLSDPKLSVSLEIKYSGGHYAATAGGSPIADYTGVFSAAYSVVKDINTTAQDKHTKINVLLNALRLASPEDLLNGTPEVALLSGSSAQPSGGGAGTAGGKNGTSSGGGN